MVSRHRLVRLAVTGGLLIPAVALGACGSSSKKSTSASTPASTGSSAAQPHNLSVTVTETGKTVAYTVPASVPGGLVQLTLNNNAGKMSHGGQLIRVIGNHSPAEVLKIVGGNNTKTPAWIRGAGGLGGVAPGATAKAILNLTAGNYLILDAGGPGSNGPPAYKQFTVTAGTAGPLPSTPITIDAANPAKDKYRYELSGSLKAGDNVITFKSEGRTAIHTIIAARLTGNPSKAQLLAALKSQSNGPPKYIDPRSISGTAVLDGGSSQVTPLTLTKPGKYVLFCPLSDREGGKDHIAEGMVTTVTVQ